MPYPILQILCRFGQIWYETEYFASFLNFQFKDQAQLAALFCVAIFTPIAGVGSFITFLIFQKNAWWHLCAELDKYGIHIHFDCLCGKKEQLLKRTADKTKSLRPGQRVEVSARRRRRRREGELAHLLARLNTSKTTHRPIITTTQHNHQKKQKSTLHHRSLLLCKVILTYLDSTVLEEQAQLPTRVKWSCKWTLKSK